MKFLIGKGNPAAFDLDGSVGVHALCRRPSTVLRRDKCRAIRQQVNLEFENLQARAFVN